MRATYEGASAYQPEPLFRVDYSLAVWQQQEDVLEHRIIDGCRLLMDAGGMGVAEEADVSNIVLNARAVEVRAFEQSGFITYGFSNQGGDGGGYYLFLLELPEQETMHARCRGAGEVVLNTFRLVGE